MGSTGIRAAILVLIALSVAGCGYRFAGGGTLPGGIQTVNVQVFQNRTAETGLESLVTNDVIYEFTRSGQNNVVDRETADAFLSGSIDSMRIDSIARRSYQSTSERQIVLTGSAKLKGKNDDVIWEAKGIAVKGNYLVGAGDSDSERNKSDRIKELSKRLAEKIYQRLTDNF